MHQRSLSCRQLSLRIALLALAAAGCWGCKKSEPPPEPAPAALTQPEPAKQQPAAPAAKPFTPAWPPPPGTEIPIDNTPLVPRPGWTKLSLEDTLPICVFASGIERDKAQLIELVKPQTLAAKSSVAFGVFGPWCLNRACDEIPTLQCWVDREGDDTFVVSTRFHSFHKTGSKCTKECLEIDAACETPPLEPGKYKIRHGSKTYKLQIPSVMRSPCLK